MEYNPKMYIPVPVEEIVEFSFGIQIIPLPSLRRAYDIDSFTSNNMTEIMVDQEVLESQSPNRYRFSLAHELAHVVLHKEVISALQFSSCDEWVKVMQTIPEPEYAYLERQANDFAGLFLVPRDVLSSKLQEAIEMARQQKVNVVEDPEIAEPFICGWLSKQFNVSDQVIQIRLQRDNAWPPPVR